MFNLANTHYDPDRKLCSGPKRKDFYGPEMTIVEAALFVLGRCGEKVVQVIDSTGEQLTAAPLIRNSQLVAANLLRLGMLPGDVVGISTNDNTQLTAVMIGAFLCGTPTNSFYPDFDKESVAAILKITTPKIIFCEVENYSVIKVAVGAYNSNPHIYLMNGHIKGEHSVEELLNENGTNTDNHMSYPCAQLCGDDTAVILCSSGTTGTPKGVLCSHKSLLNAQIYSQPHSDDGRFTFSTMYWASGLWNFTSAILNGAKRVISDKPFTPEYFFHLVEKHKITHIISGKGWPKG